MVARISSVVIHCADPTVLGPFWSLVTGIPVVEEDRLAIERGSLAPGESVLLRNAGGGPDVWITPAEVLRGPGRVHLDIEATADERARIQAAGATVVAERDRWTVMADPEGNEFCVVHERH